jgi:hypothetical protein
VPLGTQRRCRDLELFPIEAAIFLTLVVVGVALLE